MNVIFFIAKQKFSAHLIYLSFSITRYSLGIVRNVLKQEFKPKYA